MLQSFLRLFSSPQPPRKIESGLPNVTLYAKVPKPVDLHAPQATPKTQSRGLLQNQPQPVPHVPTVSTHRQRLLSMKLEHTRICSPRRAERLAELGIETAGDLANCDPDRIAKKFGSPKKAAHILRQYRRAVRLAASVPGMMPRDAMLLVCIHRRSVRGLAHEKPVVLHRDLERFAESSTGQSQLRGRRLPSVRRLKRWIEHCESMYVRHAAQARVA
ncbi:DUF4332 domain-containing protein [Rubripirellula amarantea]|uniref:DUF4332 domain-containing protein n=1 Tax=Rubripirellula amarantea TaxID=2527999 RepID=A0A5C5WI38_9BACT|nr:DUF4332 domain-containing protein [Rubripirellula amarantea]MDA8743837.1 DUF4332 domain-containing protein [Rubripirellula amarantea]TWT49673.1 hypothetical protein Pla22_48710 [Rubripirellula amarantea]